MARLAGRIAYVTGAAGGIGRAVVAALARDGAVVYAGDREPAEIAGAAAVLTHDVTDPAGWDAAFARIKDERGRLDILVNNAGVFLLKSLGETTLAEFRRLQAVNVHGAFLGMKGAAALMAEREPAEGAIVNISSIAALRALPDCFAYGVSKEALRLMSKAVGVELGRKGTRIRVNAVLPGTVKTPLTLDAYGEAIFEPGGLVADLVPLGRAATREEIAETVAFLASDEAAFMTASDTVIDGGWVAS